MFLDIYEFSNVTQYYYCPLHKKYVYHIGSTMPETCSEYILMIYIMMEINSWMARYRGFYGLVYAISKNWYQRLAW